MGMWTCKKHGLSVLEETAYAFCARRYEESLDGRHDASFSSCVNCDRGVFLYEAGAHRQKNNPPVSPFAKGGAEGDPKPEVSMELIKRKCKTHGEYETKRSNGVCPSCKDVKKVLHTDKAPVIMKRKEKPGSVVAVRPSVRPSVRSQYPAGRYAGPREVPASA